MQSDRMDSASDDVEKPVELLVLLAAAVVVVDEDEEEQEVRVKLPLAMEPWRR